LKPAFRNKKAGFFFVENVLELVLFPGSKKGAMEDWKVGRYELRVVPGVHFSQIPGG
jgi:hypothetical protein